MPDSAFKLYRVYKDMNGDPVMITNVYSDGLYPIEGTVLESDGKTTAFKRSYTLEGRNNHDMTSVRDLVPNSDASTAILSDEDLLQKRIAEAVLLLYDNGFIIKKAS
jgi:hypothetical protein